MSVDEVKKFLDKLDAFDKEWQESKEAEDMSFDPLPPGDYEAIVIDAKLTESQNSNIGLNIQFEITNGEYEGRYLFHTFWITSKNIPYLKRDMGKLGYTPTSSKDIIHAKTRIMNKKAILHVRQEEYEGVIRNKIKGFSKLENNPRELELKDDAYQF